MKKILLFAASLFGLNVAMAQDNCMSFFPDTEGTVLVNTTYDANDNPLRKMEYRVTNVSNYMSGNSMEVGFSIMNNDDMVMDQGIIDASCTDGTFRMKMRTMALTPEIMDILSTSTELVGNFLDYPNIFNDATDPFTSPFTMSGGDFTIQSKDDNKNDIRVRVYNRQYEGNEKIFVPARRDSFDAAKVTFTFEVTKNGNTTRYKGKEWYSNNHGIIRSETYSEDDMLINKSLLTSISEIRN